MQHYDVIVLGEGLAARIAALLLARGGCRVLAFRNPTTPSAVTPAWFFPSLFLERLLENLGGRSCYTPVAPFQVLTSKTRLEFLGRESMEGELQREFPCENGGISAVLGLLQKLGSRLEEDPLAKRRPAAYRLTESPAVCVQTFAPGDRIRTFPASVESLERHRRL